jgi:hypothetical protein
MVTFPSASTKIGPVVIGKSSFCRRYGNPFKVSFLITLPAATGVVPEANGAVPKVSSFAMILPTTFTVA